ncbi:hypothetical protein [Streptomyces sp. NPDC057250]|uniref:hypothetical protein n=1 Tax=Streptomyces sp. NPDC057250 TaxID=3346068 RepID=UPI003636CE88
MSHDQHPTQCCCCARAAQAAAEEPQPFRLSDLRDIPRNQWIGGAIMFAVIAVLALARHM